MNKFLFRTSSLMVLGLLLALPATAQSRKDRRQIEETIHSYEQNPAYLSAMGHGATAEEADKQALANLSSQIVVTVSSDIDVNTNVSDGTQGFSKQEEVNSKIKTYSFTNLSDVKRIEYGDEPEVNVFRYMPRSQVTELFDARRDKILNFIQMGRSNEAKLQIGNAIRYYNWALLLLQSYPYESSFKMDVDGTSYPVKAWLDSHIDEVLKHLSVRVADAEENPESEYPYELRLDINYDGQPVSNLDYYYHNGYSYIGPISAKDGRAQINFDEFPQKFRFRVECIFRSQAVNLDQELRTVLEYFQPQPFPAATQEIEVGKSVKKVHKEALAAERVAEPQPEMVMEAGGAVAANDVQVLEIERLKEEKAPEKSVEEILQGVMERIEQAVRTRNYASVQECFTDSGYVMFQKLAQYGNASVMGAHHTYEFLRTPERTYCRSLPMQFRFKGNREFFEDVTFRFNPAGLVESLAFTVSKIAENDILKMNKWDEGSRLALIAFLEDYQTAYALKRIDYIESIFSDDAWIITGTVLKKANLRPEQQLKFDQKDVKYTTYTKTEYIDKLRLSFDSKEFINLRFEDNDVYKSSSGEEIYAIQIKQDYYSNNYGDTGYLTLLVDLRGELPIIHIRVWQEFKDEDFNASKFLGSIKM